MRRRSLPFLLLGVLPLVAGLVALNPGSAASAAGGATVVTTSFGSAAKANAAVVQANGTVFAIGQAASGSGDVAVAKYRANGTLDPSFSGDGKATFDFKPSNPGATSADFGVFGQLQSSGKLVVVLGHRTKCTGCTPMGGVLVRRINVNGTLDKGYEAGNDGNALMSGNPTVVGSGGGNGTIGYGVVLPGGQLRYQRSDQNGNILASDNGGLFMGNGSSLAAGISPNGKIVVAGGNGGNVRAIRLNPDMSQDMTFGTGGVTSVNLGGGDDHATDVAVNSSGKIVITAASSAQKGHFSVIRLASNGKIDTTFNGNGVFSPDLGGTGNANSVVWDSAGRMVVAGTIDGQMAVARFSGAKRDGTFAGGGFLRIPIGSSSTGLGVELQGTAKVVVVGSSGANFAVARIPA